jgi:hypothetical protein
MGGGSAISRVRLPARASTRPSAGSEITAPTGISPRAAAARASSSAISMSRDGTMARI